MTFIKKWNKGLVISWTSGDNLRATAIISLLSFTSRETLALMPAYYPIRKGR
jgi:hypothetical protein